MLLSIPLRRMIQIGTFTLIDAAGRTHRFEGRQPGGAVTVKLHDKALHRRLLFNAHVAVGEAYMNGTLTIEEGTLYDFLHLMMENIAAAPRGGADTFSRRLDYMLRWIHQFNPRSRARKNVAHHYDLSSTLYDLFLDADRQYSCAYFENPDDTLETAQANKKRHLAAKLLLQPGLKALDIGSGWGGLALYLADETGVDVTGLTLSTEQVKLAQERAAKAGISDQVRFRLQDYREEKSRYDRIVSVGMFEHVGVLHYQEYFDKIAELLTADGVAVIHTVGRSEGPGTMNPWLRKYIFPGAYAPALSEILGPVERSGLVVTDIEVLRLHYAETLRHWRRRFTANRDRIRAIYDERFCRMWEFYLTSTELAFRVDRFVVFQLQLTKPGHSFPATRDYITDWEVSRQASSEETSAIASQQSEQPRYARASE